MFNKDVLIFLCLVAAALGLSYVPFAHVPFSWTSTFFHEISHGLAALVSGGRIVSVALETNGAGLCVTLGGSAFLITFSGYAGTVLWGMLIYKAVDHEVRPVANAVCAAISALILVTLTLWADNVLTRAILLAILSIFVALFWFRESVSLRYPLQFIALYVVLDGIRAPLYLIDGRSIGDGEGLAELTFIPEFVWIALWFGMAVYGLVFLFQQEFRSSKNEFVDSDTLP